MSTSEPGFAAICLLAAMLSHPARRLTATAERVAVPVPFSRPRRETAPWGGRIGRMSEEAIASVSVQDSGGGPIDELRPERCSGAQRRRRRSDAPREVNTRHGQVWMQREKRAHRGDDAKAGASNGGSAARLRERYQRSERGPTSPRPVRRYRS